MDEYTIRQAIDLIKARRPLDARKLLRPVLEVNPENEAAWVWFTSTFIAPQDKLQVMRQASLYLPKSQPILRGIEKLVEEIDNLRETGENLEESDISAYMPHFAEIDREGLDNFKPGDLPPSWSATPVSEPAVKEPSRPRKTAAEDPVDWIKQLRITSNDDVPEEKPVRAPFSWEEPDLPVFQPEPVFEPEPPPVFNSPPPASWEPVEDYRISPPPKRENLPPKRVPPAKEIPPWEMPMQSTALQDVHPYSRQQAPIQQPRVKFKDPYQKPFITAAMIGGFLLLLLMIIMYVIVAQTT